MMRRSRTLACMLAVFLLLPGCSATRRGPPGEMPRVPPELADASPLTLRLFEGRLTPREPSHRPYAEFPDAACAHPALDLLRSGVIADTRWHDRVTSALILMMRAAAEEERPWLRRAVELVVWDRCAADLERSLLGRAPLPEAWPESRIAAIRKEGMPETLDPADLEDLEELRRVFAFAGGTSP